MLISTLEKPQKWGGDGGNLALRSRVLFHLAPLVRKSLSILIEPELSEPKARTRAKQFARSSPHKKKGRLTTDSFFNVWRWRESVTLVDILFLVRKAHHHKISHSLDLHSGARTVVRLRAPSVRFPPISLKQ